MNAPTETGLGIRQLLAEAGSLDELVWVLCSTRETLARWEASSLALDRAAAAQGQHELERELPRLAYFGGAAPSDTHGVWSWDHGRLLVTGGVHGFQLVPR